MTTKHAAQQYHEMRTKRDEVERLEDWRGLITKGFPFIKMQKGWKVSVIPPFNGAVARFNVRKGEKSVSVYLDCFDRLGYMEQPYWEVYPYQEDVGRCYLTETDKLAEMIAESLREPGLWQLFIKWIKDKP